MKQLQEISQQEDSMRTLADLTNVFEGLASMKIAKIKNEVKQAETFFQELWNIYRQLRVDDVFRFGRSASEKGVINKELFIIITSEGSFSGDIDQKLIGWMLSGFDATKQDIVVIGHHGVVQLAQRGVTFKKYFKMPLSDTNVNVEPLIKEIKKYRNCCIYYQTYVSLMVQDVKRIDLSKATQEHQAVSDVKAEVISRDTYIFEPSTIEVASHLEQSMISSMLGQVIFESKLAQYASRFRAMSAAHQKADDTVSDLHTDYNRTKRAIKDERLKEIINGMRKVARV